MQERLKVKKIKPMFTSLITTMDSYEADVLNEAGLIDTTKRKGTLKEYQTVVAIGSAVRDIKVGDLVCINPIRFAEKKHTPGSLKDGIITDNPTVNYRFDVVELDDIPHLLLRDTDISFVVDEYEFVK
jgi:hypothetical protein